MKESNIPVIIGTGQLVDREADIDQHIEPLDMLARVAHGARKDAELTEQDLQKLDTIALVGILGWHPDNAPNLVAEKIGAHPKHEYVSGTGGQVGVTLLNSMASEIVRGESEFALIAGCNNLKVLLRAIAAKKRLAWTRGGTGTPVLVGGDEPGSSELEGRYGLEQPTDIYPLFENSMRAKLGLNFDQHNQRMGSLFTRFSEVAAGNEYAWFPTQRSAEELTTVTAENRMICFPYPKYLNAVLNTEQAAGLILCSAEKARALGVPEEKWVYWWGGAHSQEKAWWASERPDFTECPSMKDTHVSALTNAGVEVTEIDHFDFYSCFPIAVQMACDVLDLSVDDPRGFTVTGGLPYAGGPASAYTLHSIADMAQKLRDNAGQKGLVTGNGWYLTKHSAVVLSSAAKESAPKDGLLAELPSGKMQTSPVAVNTAAEGGATIESYTVSYDREGKPYRGIVLGSTEAGCRFLANTPDSIDFLEDFVSNEQVGVQGHLNIRAGHTIFEK
ncbi:MAG: acetyl-CoA acetyltransferase [Gammaproteobacteria bacterium]|nr:acetyl-CoA acetyltransferase [Gammaproteobacteria bacterium]